MKIHIPIHEEKHCGILLEQIREHYQKLSEETGPRRHSATPLSDGTLMMSALQHYCTYVRHLTYKTSYIGYQRSLAESEARIRLGATDRDDDPCGASAEELPNRVLGEIDEIIRINARLHPDSSLDRASAIDMAITRWRVDLQRLLEAKDQLESSRVSCAESSLANDDPTGPGPGELASMGGHSDTQGGQ